jgi:pyruvate/2-oxoglutarate dehydrogenase complex dihydrolipoamide dehydrogenase (E3) component
MDRRLARIGLSERAARACCHHIQVAKLPMTSVARALELDETRGLMKAVVDAGNDQILGSAILTIHSPN